MKKTTRERESLPVNGGVRRSKRPVGPVPNLEEHVRPDWWCGLFNALYLKTDGDVVDDPGMTRGEVDVIFDILDLKPETSVLDLCCGHGRHSLELARRGLQNVEGFDRSHYLVQRARTAAKREQFDTKFREGDARKLPHRADTFDCVLILGNSFGYFETVQDDVRVLREVHRILKPWGRILIDLADGDYVKTEFDARSWEWIGRRHFACRERSLSVDEQRLITREIVTDTTKGVVADQFYAERLYSRDALLRLLQESGFTDVTWHGEVTTLSQRNQDLGMMARRLIVTGLVRKEWTPAAKQRVARDTKRVTVVLGDPTRPDTLKPSSVFDDDDLYTIDQMKAALQQSPSREFRYVTEHGNLIDDLRKLRGQTDLVFNLCDEGYDNNPHRELHVPALLEMLDLPYTGGGPQCLAYCYDKSLVRGVAKEMDVPVPAAFLVKSEDATFEVPFGFPVIVKPNFGDSSFGITQRSVAHGAEDLLNAVAGIRLVCGYDKPLIVEELLTGKDLTVGIIGNPPGDFVVLPIVEEDYSGLPVGLPRICGYEAKWDPGSPYWQTLKSVRAELDAATEQAIVNGCFKLFDRFECRDYARFDWRLDGDGEPRLLEINPNPGWCWDGHLAKMAQLDGISYAAMLEMILQAAEQRYRR